MQEGSHMTSFLNAFALTLLLILGWVLAKLTKDALNNEEEHNR
jgi:hypothetical protein